MAFEMREPRAQSLAYTMSAGVGRGRSLDGSSVISSVPTCAGRGSLLQAAAVNNDRRRMDMTNAQKPYDQYLVIVCRLFALKLMLKFKNFSKFLS